MLKKIKIIIVAILFITSITVNAKDGVNKDTLIMGTSPDYPIFEFIQDGEIIGLDIDLANLIVNKLGKKLVIQTMDFSSLIPAINSGKIDFSMAGFSKEEKRLNFIDFSDIYFKENFAIISLTSNPINTLEALKGKKIVAQTGSTGLKYAISLKQKIDNLEIKALENNFTALEELKSGRINAMIIGEMQANVFTQNNDGLFYISVPNDIDTGTAIIFKKNSDLTSEFNKVLKQLEEEGKIAELKEKWFSYIKQH